MFFNLNIAKSLIRGRAFQRKLSAFGHNGNEASPLKDQIKQIMKEKDSKVKEMNTLVKNAAPSEEITKIAQEIATITKQLDVLSTLSKTGSHLHGPPKGPLIALGFVAAIFCYAIYLPFRETLRDNHKGKKITTETTTVIKHPKPVTDFPSLSQPHKPEKYYGDDDEDNETPIIKTTTTTVIREESISKESISTEKKEEAPIIVDDQNSQPINTEVSSEQENTESSKKEENEEDD